MGLLSDIANRRTAETRFAAFTGAEARRRDWLAAWCAGQVDLDRSLASVTALTSWFEVSLDAGLPGVPRGRRPVYWSRDWYDAPRHRRWFHDVLAAGGHQLVDPVTDRSLGLAAELVAEALAGYAADVCRALDPTFAWLVAPADEPRWRGVAVLDGPRGRVRPVQAAAAYVDDVLLGRRGRDGLRRELQADLHAAGLADAPDPLPAPPAGHGRLPRPWWVRLDPTAAALYRSYSSAHHEAAGERAGAAAR
jgi:hypothetical protein